MQPDLDLTHRAWTASRDGLTAIGTWVRLEQRWRPCMALIRTGDDGSKRAIPCVVTVDNAWIWSEEIGDPRRVARVVFLFLQALRLDPDDERDHFKIISMVTDHLGDLMHIPPRPAFEADRATPVAEIVIDDHQSGKRIEAEI
jgi:hypothetical protein